MVIKMKHSLLVMVSNVRCFRSSCQAIWEITLNGSLNMLTICQLLQHHTLWLQLAMCHHFISGTCQSLVQSWHCPSFKDCLQEHWTLYFSFFLSTTAISIPFSQRFSGSTILLSSRPLLIGWPLVPKVTQLHFKCICNLSWCTGKLIVILHSSLLLNHFYTVR